jgi:hypothetical protein
VEMMIARYLGGTRNPITGRTRNQGVPDIGKAKEVALFLPDAEHFLEKPQYKKILNGCIFDDCTFEIKHRKALPKWLMKLQNLTIAENNFIYFADFSITNLNTFRNVYFDEPQLTKNKHAAEQIQLPKWILDAKDQCEKTGDTPNYAVVLHGKNQRIKDSLVLIFRGN